MDALNSDALWVVVVGFLIAFILEGAVGSVQDACRGLCTQLTGYFCDPFLAVCTPCHHCNTKDLSGCEKICHLLRTTMRTVTSEMANMTSTATTALPLSTSSDLPDRGVTESHRVSDHSFTTPYPKGVSTALVFALLGSGVVLICAGWFYCYGRTSVNALRKREPEDIEMGSIRRRRPCRRNPGNAGERPGQTGDTDPSAEGLLANQAEGAARGVIPVSVPVNGNGDRSPGLRRLVREEEIGPAKRRCKTAASQTHISGLAGLMAGVWPWLGRLGGHLSGSSGVPSSIGNEDPDTGSLTPIGSLHSNDEQVQVERHQGAVPTRNSPEAEPSQNPQGAEQLATSVQDGTHDQTDYALAASPFNPLRVQWVDEEESGN